MSVPVTNAPRICVVIPVYGNWDDAVDCLRSLHAQTRDDFEILVADDGSPEPPPPAIHAFPLARYTRGENLGFGLNCNRAANIAIASGATHILFLNSDTTFGSRFMERWLKRAAERPAAILSPVIYWAHRPNAVWSSGGRFGLLTPFIRARQEFTDPTEVDIVTGCAFLAPVKAWTALGGFNPRYKMYFEDFDFTLRARDAGMQTWVLPDPDLHVLHHVSGSFRGRGVWQHHYYMLTSCLIFVREHYRGLFKPAGIALTFAHLAVMAVWSLPQLPRLKPLWLSVRRGFTG